MRVPLLASTALAVLVLLLNGCAIYSPMQAAAPQITDKNQVELTGNSYLNNRLRLAATYSPVRHLLLHAAASHRGGRRDSSYHLGHQYDVGVGTYWPLGSKWLVGGLAGYGWARSAARYRDGIGFFTSPVLHELEVRYTKPFGEAYASFRATEQLSFGAAYRLTGVRFQQLTDVGLPVPIRQMTRSELMLFTHLRASAFPALGLQLAVGSSAKPGYHERTAGDRSDAEREVLKSRGYISVGLSLQPHLLKSTN